MNALENVAPEDGEKWIVFPKGLGGFEEYHEFKLLRSEQPDSPLYWFESVKEPTVSFTVVDPRVYGLNYQFDLNDEERATLECKEEDELLVLLMLAKRETAESSQASIYGNIAGPILVNARTRLAHQKVLHKKRVELNVIGI
jgi:flagellar assembly factor FliW